MHSMRTARLLATLVLCLVVSHARAEIQAKLVETRKIWDQAQHTADTDLVRFQNRWFCVCREGNSANSPDGVLRVITSADGQQWESAAVIKSKAPGKGLYDPKLSVTPDGYLMLSAAGLLPETTLQAMTWLSKDGRDWSGSYNMGGANYTPSRVTWHQGTAYSYAYGRICGIAQTIQIRTSKNGEQFNDDFQETFSGFFPYGGSLFFDGDTGYCLMTRVGTPSGSPPGYLGTAKAPFGIWKWKETDKHISDPNLIRLPDGRIIAAVGLYDKQARTALCEFDPVTGKLTEFLELPTAGAIDVGLAYHDGHLWISYHGTKPENSGVHLAKVKIQ